MSCARADPASAQPADALARALAFMRDAVTKTADRVRSIEAGWVVLTPSLPAVWVLNQLRVAEPLPFEEIVRLADRHLAATGYRQVAVEDQETGPALERAFATAGWRVDRELLMILSAGSERTADTGLVIDAGEDEVAEIMTRWHDDGRNLPAEELSQLTEYSRREARVCADRLLGVRSGDGQLVAVTKLRSDGRTAQVEDVYTAPEARGRGFATALVSHAIALARGAGHELVFIVADATDWPQLLYGQLGFRPLGRLWQFHRD